MVKVWIDNTCVEMTEGQTVLDAARKLGLDIPALCWQANHPPNTSCMCCLVRVEGSPGLVPSCGTKVRDGLRVQSETAEIHELRRTGIELLLADHAGDCRAPCENTCPAHMDVPNMLRHVADGDYRAAIEIVKRDIALPAILGRVCPEVCEQACRRGQHDSPAAICRLKQFVADRDLASDRPYHPPLAAPTGRAVAIVGAGPTGLTAAFHLRQRGHRCVLIEQRHEVGGRLNDEFAPELPRSVLQREAAVVLEGVEQHLGLQLGQHISVEELLADFDAVLLCTGRSGIDWCQAVGIQTTNSGIRVDANSRMTTRSGVFAAGNVVRPYKLVVQSVAEGKLAAQCVDACLLGGVMPDRHRVFETRLARLTAGELCSFCEGFPDTPRLDERVRAEDLTDEQAQQEANRCLHCDCPALDSCRLHHYASLYHCDAHRFQTGPRRFEGRLVSDGVVLEHGKCILCGICVQLARETNDAAGLTWLGRSTECRIGPPPGVSLARAMGSAAGRCAAACPTGAIQLVPHQPIK